MVIRTKDVHDGSHIFVVAAQSDGNSSWSNYLADAVVYEVSGDGDVVSMVTLPRLVQRNEFCVLDDRIAWNCQDGSMASILPTTRDVYSSDTYTQIDWRSCRKPVNRDAWLRQGSYYDARDFCRTNVFSIDEGGYIERRDSQDIKFPISLTNLATGDRRELLITLPFEGTAPVPTRNYSHGPDGWTALSHYLFVITDIHFSEDTLSVSVEDDEQQNRVLEFEVAADGSLKSQR